MKDKSIQWQMKFWLAKWFGFIFGEIGHEPEEIESDEEWNGLDELIKQKLLQNADVILKYLDEKGAMVWHKCEECGTTKTERLVEE